MESERYLGDSAITSLWCCQSLRFFHSKRCVMASHFSINFQFPNEMQCKESFNILIYHLDIFFCKMYVQIFDWFFNQALCYTIVEFWEFFVYFTLQIILWYIFCKYFLPVWGLSSASLQCLLQSRSFNFNEVQFINDLWFLCCYISKVIIISRVI